MRATIADAAELRVEAVDRIADLQGGTLQGVSPTAVSWWTRARICRTSTAVVSLEWLREVRALLGPPDDGAAAVVVSNRKGQENSQKD